LKENPAVKAIARKANNKPGMKIELLFILIPFQKKWAIVDGPLIHPPRLGSTVISRK
jgi:hypothetical protein